MKRGGYIGTSDKRKADAELRRDLTAEMLAEVPWCVIGKTLEAAISDPRHAVGDRLIMGRWHARCTVRATQLHELRKRSAGGSILNRANCVQSCTECNTGFVENEPRLAQRLGLVVRQGDVTPAEWEALGSRADRFTEAP